MSTIQSAQLVSISKLYRDAMRVAEIVAYQQGTNKSTLQTMVRAAFRDQQHLVDDAEIMTAKQAAITAMGNYHAIKAVELAMQYRDAENVNPDMGGQEKIIRHKPSHKKPVQ